MTAETNGLRSAIEALGGSMKDWTVLSEARDPFRLDTPANHLWGRWLRDAFEQRNLPAATGGQIHNRRVHYRLLGHPKPDGWPYGDGDNDWVWISEKVIKAARWLDYIPWEWIRDNRNDAPELHLRELPDPDPGVVTSPAHVIYLPDAADLKPRADLPGFHGTQLYHLVMVGEKSSLREDLVALAERFQADWYLPDGEISDTHIWLMAKPAVADGRMLVLLYFADCDPAGHQMILSVTRKLQAFQRFPGLESLQFVAYRVLLTPDQVRAYGLPSSPLNSGEKRGPAWKAAYGVEQTEVDALMDADPDAIQNIAGELIEGRFFDTTLAARVEAVRDRWLTQAQEIVDEQDSQVQARADVVARLEQIEQEATAEVEALVTAVAPTDIDPDGLPSVPAIPEPEVDEDDQPEPLCDSRWSFAVQTRRLIASKNYEI